jgi:hypothetical protein
MNEELSEKIKIFEDSCLTVHPGVFTFRHSNKFGRCQKCNIYFPLFSYDNKDFFCRDCIREVYLEAWINKQKIKSEVFNKIRKEKALQQEREERRKKRFTPINLRK